MLSIDDLQLAVKGGEDGHVNTMTVKQLRGSILLTIPPARESHALASLARIQEPERGMSRCCNVYALGWCYGDNLLASCAILKLTTHVCDSGRERLD